MNKQPVAYVCMDVCVYCCFWDLVSMQEDIVTYAGTSHNTVVIHKQGGFC